MDFLVHLKLQKLKFDKIQFAHSRLSVVFETTN